MIATDGKTNFFFRKDENESKVTIEEDEGQNELTETGRAQRNEGNTQATSGK